MTHPTPQPGDVVTAAQSIRLGTIARDAEGDLWRFGRTRWSCMAPVDGTRVTRVARMQTSEVLRDYGPLVVERIDR